MQHHSKKKPYTLVIVNQQGTPYCHPVCNHGFQRVMPGHFLGMPIERTRNSNHRIKWEVRREWWNPFERPSVLHLVICKLINVGLLPNLTRRRFVMGSSSFLLFRPLVLLEPSFLSNEWLHLITSNSILVFASSRRDVLPMNLCCPHGAFFHSQYRSYEEKLQLFHSYLLLEMLDSKFALVH